MGKKKKPDFKLVKMGFLPLAILALVLPQLNAFCLKQGCDKYFEKVKTDAKVTGACAVLFEGNCCKNVGTFGDAKKLFVCQEVERVSCVAPPKHSSTRPPVSSGLEPPQLVRDPISRTQTPREREASGTLRRKRRRAPMQAI